MTRMGAAPDPPNIGAVPDAAVRGSCVRLIDFVYHSTLGLRVIKKKK